MNYEYLMKNLRSIEDFPVQGVNFRDVTTLFKNAKCIEIMDDELYELYLQELTPDQKALLPRIRETNYEQALDYHVKGLENSKEKSAQMDAEVAKLDAQIAELDQQLDEIYAQWNASKKK